MKKILSGFLLLALTLTTTTVVFAQGDDPPIPDPPVDSAVLDTLDWLSPTQEDEINSLVFALDKEGLAQMAVVTLDDCGADAQIFRNQLFRDWGIGHVDDNDGLLIMVCWYGGVKGQRSLEQEVGYGLEGTIPDLLTDRMFNEYFVPAFSRGKPDGDVISSGEAGEALVSMVAAYDDVLRQQPEAVPAENTETEGSSADGLLTIVILIIAVFVVIGILGAGSGNNSSETEDDIEIQEPPVFPTSFSGGSLSSRRSSRRRSREEDYSDDDDDDDSGRSGGFSSGGNSSGLSSGGGFDFGGGSSGGAGSSGKF